jgi:FAD-dependent urate hydroxylase
MTDTRSALVIGGGIAGPATAMALQKAGIEATVYEAYHSTAEAVGGGLSIAPNGQAALAVLGAEDVVRRIGIP